MKYLFLKRIVENKQCYFELTWSDEFGELGLKLFDGQKFYKGKVTLEDFELFSSKTSKSLEDIWSETISVFKDEEHDNNKSEFFLEIKYLENDLEVVVTWKKLLGGDDVKQRLGSVVLRCSTEDSEMTALLDDLLLLICSQKKSVGDLTKEKNDVLEGYNNVLKKLDELTIHKERIEVDLFSKFALVLNAKKDKIKHLKEELEQLKQSVHALPDNECTDDDHVDKRKSKLKGAKSKKPAKKKAKTTTAVAAAATAAASTSSKSRVNVESNEIIHSSDFDTDTEESDHSNASQEMTSVSLPSLPLETAAELQSLPSSSAAAAEPTAGPSSSAHPYFSSPAPNLNSSSLLVFGDSQTDEDLFQIVPMKKKIKIISDDDGGDINDDNIKKNDDKNDERTDRCDENDGGGGVRKINFYQTERVAVGKRGKKNHNNDVSVTEMKAKKPQIDDDTLDISKLIDDLI
ncbi:hypothetical protein HELRODRAFT_194751 [Helobdella robusta]|uniref:DNA repair protein XRCC4 n=1 Tax=Helobdella robusta TaxID=6412 RepID=T1FWD3_HELRO|nr:hypothetical protein HELRODRAFT_194751 [Helobdella robusta]ESN89901.1 hypothetical protein HELRODRAFT_194751 [Helobdella robusta]